MQTGFSGKAAFPSGQERKTINLRQPSTESDQAQFWAGRGQTIKESCLDRIILVGEASLRRAVRAFVDHYHHERNHQGLGNRLIAPVAEPANHDDYIACRARLGGLLKYYHRPAA